MTLTVVVAPGRAGGAAQRDRGRRCWSRRSARFGEQAIPFEADFFTDLGGHSLIAARFVSAIRETPALASVTFQDVYAKRTLRAIADELIARTGGAGAATVARDMSFEPPPLLRRFLCGLAQAVALPIILTLTTVQWLGIFVTYLLLTGEGLGFWAEMGALLAVYAMLNIVTAIIAVAGKWLVLGRTKPGRYPLWGVYYFRWWFAKRLETLVHLKWLQGSPMMAMYLRLIGGKVGRDVIIADIDAGALDLVTIGDGTTIGSKTKIANVEIIGNEMVIGRVDIGADVSIGSSCTLAHDITVGAHAELADLTAIAPGTRIGDAERWDGSPGRRVGTVDVAALPEPAEASFAHRRVFDALYVFILMAVPPISLLPIFPAFALFDQIDDVISEFLEVSYLWYLPVLAWPTALFMIFATVLLIALIRWAILPRVNSGRYSIFSGFYLRKWTVALATEVTLETLTSLYATVYMRRWYRGMGASIGHGAEISTNLAGRYDLSTIGAKNFIADEVVFGDEDVRRGWMTLEPVRTEDRVFVGNDAVVPPGAVIPEGVLIGIKSKPPANHEMSPGDTWFGSPPIKLPTRQKVDMGAMWTYEPSAWKKLGAASSRRCTPRSRRCCSSPSRSCRSTTCSIRPSAPGVGDAGARFVAASVLIPIAQTLVVIAVKWLTMGVYRPLMKPMWSWWAMRTEAVAVLYWGLAGKVLLEHLQGTPFLPWVLRLLGAKFGRGVCMHTTDITEFDCVTVGRLLHHQRALGAADASLRGPGDEGRPGAPRGGRDGRGEFHRALRQLCGRLRPAAPAHRGDEGRGHPGAFRWEGAPAVPVVHSGEELRQAA
jgi:non-ribosomal peptide synthetase-like protein